MQIKKAEIGKIFEKLKLDVRSTKHRYGWFTFEGRKILRVHYLHGKGTIPGRVSDKIRSQLKLTQNDLRDLIGCPLSLKELLQAKQRIQMDNEEGQGGVRAELA